MSMCVPAAREDRVLDSGKEDDRMHSLTVNFFCVGADDINDK